MALPAARVGNHMTERQIIEALSPVSKLNSFARVEYEQRRDMTDCRVAIYAMKHRLIREAIDLGICTVRIVAVERPCKTCKGTGTYVWQDWNDENHQEYETCRRCAGTPGTVILRFVETDIAGMRWHTPRPKADFLAHLRLDWENCKSTGWLPEQPGRPLTGRELNVTLNEAERVIFAGKLLRWHNGWRGSVYDYSLNFGMIEECFVCGRNPARRQSGFNWPNSRDVFRPGMRWSQCVCPECADKADRWPRQWPANLMPHHNRGRWIDECPRWTMNAPWPLEAQSDVVQEWLARRGIRIGYPVPGNVGVCYMAGTEEWLDLVAIRGDDAFVKFSDYRHWKYVDRTDAGLFRIPADLLRARNMKLLTAGGIS
jgi:hypothetical protein